MPKDGAVVHVHYRGTLDDGTEFDSSYSRNEPLTFTIGAQQMIPGFEAAVVPLEVGEEVTVHIPAADAYGEYDENKVQKLPKDRIPNVDNIPVGEYVMLSTPVGPIRVKVAKVDDENVYFDHNHELAGKDLNFEIKLVSVDE